MRAFKVVFSVALCMCAVLVGLAKGSRAEVVLPAVCPDSTAKHCCLKTTVPPITAPATVKDDNWPSVIANDTMGPGRIVINSMDIPAPAKKHVAKKLIAGSKKAHKTAE